MNMISNRKKTLFGAILMALGVVASLYLTAHYENIPLIWIPTGIATWMFLTCQKRCAIALLIGMLVGTSGYFLLLDWIGGPNLKPAIVLLIAASSMAFAAIVSNVIQRYFMVKTGGIFATHKVQPVIIAVVGCIALSLAIAWIIVSFLGGTSDSILLATLKIFASNTLGIIALFPLIIGKVQLEFFRETNRTRNRREYLAIAVLVFAIFAATVFAWHATSTSQFEKNTARFDALTEESEKALKNRLLSYEDAILGGAGLFYASEEVNRAEWRQYVSALDVVNRYPGINGIGYIGRVDVDDLERYIANERSSGMPDFRSHPEVDHDTHYVITFIEPVEINGPAVGLNIAFETNRRTAADLAATTGKSAITQRILLVQDAAKTPGFLLLYPIYSTGVFDELTNPETDLQGWVYAPFIGKNLLGDLTASQGQQFNVSIYDGATTNKNQLIYAESETQDAKAAEPPHFKKVRTFNVMQQDWTIEWTSTKSFEASTIDFQAELILITGIVIGGLLGLMLVSIAHRAASIQTEVDRKTREINKARGGLQAVLDTVVDGIVEISAGGRILAFNPSAEHIFGYAAADVIGKPFHTLLLKRDHSKMKAYLEGESRWLEENGMANGITITGVRKDKSTFPMELGASAFDLDDVRRYVASVRDITEQVEAQRALELSERTFRQTLENAPIAALSISPQRELIHMNKTANDMLEYSMEELQDPSILLAHPDDMDVDAEQLLSLANGSAQNFVVEKRLITKSGQTIWVEQHVSPVYNADGSIKYFIKQMINLTERKKTERIKNEFIATVSHELRTPITSISGSLSLILGAFKEEISPKVHGLLTIAQRNSTRLIALVNDILDMEKLGNGGMHYEIANVQLNELLPQIVEDNRSYAATFEADLKLEAVDSGLYINVDKWRFNQVLSNFISNAIKFSPAGGTVKVRADQNGDYARISVSDNGIGISDEFRNRIFTKFAQADSSTTREKSGTGLGLMISKQLVEQMDGRIGYTSEPNVETVFWVEFKLAAHENEDGESIRKAG
ncbi:CHASE domain-containing protein [Maritalea myrionectae]|uniref:CHASE domain-containing protein n=1 Tax=Maritalea myrionectae TaxID=454601 RepID=UPI000420D052|nr:CHASE domain-containing protein [Maritalea myrionectae]